MEYQKCPICNGNGKVSGGFYDHLGDYPYWTTDHTEEQCRTCKGEGIIIKPEQEIVEPEQKLETK